MESHTQPVSKHATVKLVWRHVRTIVYGKAVILYHLKVTSNNPERYHPKNSKHVKSVRVVFVLSYNFILKPFRNWNICEYFKCIFRHLLYLFKAALREIQNWHSIFIWNSPIFCFHSYFIDELLNFWPLWIWKYLM